MLASRLSTLIVALIACAWFGLAVRQTSDLDAASAIVQRPGPLTPAQSAHAATLLRSAETLNPDSAVRLVRARLAQRDGDSVRAVRIAEGVVRDEPRNLEAWYELASLSGREARVFFHALREINKLDPPPPKGG